MTSPDRSALPPTFSLPAQSTLSGGCSEEFQMVVHAGKNWNNGYLLANDWSYLGTTEFEVNNRVTVTLGSETLWGNAPPAD